LKKDFKMAAAQVPSVRGDMQQNLATHLAAVTAAARHEIDVLVFPELSLIGYEPDLAANLAMTAADSRLAPLIALAKARALTAIVGAPLQNATGKPALGSIIISPGGAVSTYHKMHLGAPERDYFSPGREPLTIPISGHIVGLAIYADSSQASHPQTCADLGADIYAASVFLNAAWYASDAPRLAIYAARHQMLTLMANHADSVGTYTSVGKSAIWAPDGTLLVQAEGVENALLVAVASDGVWQAEVIKI
jgi:predicted amidohydrolase